MRKLKTVRAQEQPQGFIEILSESKPHQGRVEVDPLRRSGRARKKKIFGDDFARLDDDGGLQDAA